MSRSPTAKNLVQKGPCYYYFSTKIPNQPRTKKIRVLKNFNPDGFCLDLIQADVSGLVTKEKSLEAADAIYHRELMYTAEKWAPLRTVQIRKKKGPTLSPGTKDLIATRNAHADNLQACTTPDHLQILKTLNKEIKYSIQRDKREGWTAALSSDCSPKNAWHVAKGILGQVQASSPKVLTGIDGSLVTSPKQMAEIMSSI